MKYSYARSSFYLIKKKFSYGFRVKTSVIFCNKTYKMFIYARNKKLFQETVTKIKRILNHLFYYVNKLPDCFFDQFLALNTLNIGISEIDDSKFIVDTFSVYINHPSEGQNLLHDKNSCLLQTIYIY